MTIIKQTSVSSSRHQKNLRDYINNDKKVLLRDSQNMDLCPDLKRWAWFMDKTRESFGHNKASRKGKDGKTAKNTILYHQILGFNPDECDLNGGTLRPEDCMRYAKEYIATYYPHQQVVMALHNEVCKADGTHRYAVHMVINRSDLSTGNRLNEGRGADAKRARAKRIRSMDGAWHLQQVEEGAKNSTIHAKQPSKVERAIAARGGSSYKTNLRELCRLAATKAESIYEYREQLESWGVDTQFRHGRLYATDRDNARYSFSVKKLDALLDETGLQAAFRSNLAKDIRGRGASAANTARQKQEAQAHVQSLTKQYLGEIRQAYQEYRREVHAMKGRTLEEIPKLRLRRPPEDIANDSEVRRDLLAYWRGADELRAEMAADTPARKAQTGHSRGGSGQVEQGRQRGGAPRDAGHRNDERG